MTDEGKDIFLKEIVPDLFKEIKKKFNPVAIAWASEAWVRTTDKTKEAPEDWKLLPIKKEVVIINIESNNSQKVIMYNIERNGQQITSSGNLVDIIILTLIEESPEKITGRFTGLFKKFDD